MWSNALAASAYRSSRLPLTDPSSPADSLLKLVANTIFSYPDHKARQSEKKKDAHRRGQAGTRNIIEHWEHRTYRAPQPPPALARKRHHPFQIALESKLLESISCSVPPKPSPPLQSRHLLPRRTGHPFISCPSTATPPHLFNPTISSLTTLASVSATILTATKGKIPPTMQRKRSYTQIACGQNDTASHRQLSFPSSANLGPASADTAPVQAKRARGQSKFSFPFIVLLFLDLHLHPPHIVRQLASSTMVKLLGSDGYRETEPSVPHDRVDLEFEMPLIFL